MFRFEQTGDLKVVIQGFSLGAKNFSPMARKHMGLYAVVVKEHMVDMLMGGKFDVAPLSENYAARKVRMYGARPVLIADGEYAREVKVVPTEGGDYTVGFEDGAVASNGQLFSRIAACLEFGTSTMPGRPHWRPTIEYAQQNMPSVGRKVIGDLRLVR